MFFHIGQALVNPVSAYTVSAEGVTHTLIEPKLQFFEKIILKYLLKNTIYVKKI